MPAPTTKLQNAVSLLGKMNILKGERSDKAKKKGGGKGGYSSPSQQSPRSPGKPSTEGNRIDVSQLSPSARTLVAKRRQFKFQVGDDMELSDRLVTLELLKHRHDDKAKFSEIHDEQAKLVWKLLHGELLDENELEEARRIEGLPSRYSPQGIMLSTTTSPKGGAIGNTAGVSFADAALAAAGGPPGSEGQGGGGDGASGVFPASSDFFSQGSFGGSPDRGVFDAYEGRPPHGSLEFSSVNSSFRNPASKHYVTDVRLRMETIYRTLAVLLAPTEKLERKATYTLIELKHMLDLSRQRRGKESIGEFPAQSNLGNIELLLNRELVRIQRLQDEADEDEDPEHRSALEELGRKLGLMEGDGGRSFGTKDCECGEKIPELLDMARLEERQVTKDACMRVVQGELDKILMTMDNLATEIEDKEKGRDALVADMNEEKAKVKSKNDYLRKKLDQLKDRNAALQSEIPVDQERQEEMDALKQFVAFMEKERAKDNAKMIDYEKQIEEFKTLQKQWEDTLLMDGAQSSFCVDEDDDNNASRISPHSSFRKTKSSSHMRRKRSDASTVSSMGGGHGQVVRRLRKLVKAQDKALNELQRASEGHEQRMMTQLDKDAQPDTGANMLQSAKSLVRQNRENKEAVKRKMHTAMQTITRDELLLDLGGFNAETMLSKKRKEVLRSLQSGNIRLMETVFNDDSATWHPNTKFPDEAESVEIILKSTTRRLVEYLSDLAKERASVIGELVCAAPQDTGFDVDAGNCMSTGTKALDSLMENVALSMKEASLKMGLATKTAVMRAKEEAEKNVLTRARAKPAEKAPATGKKGKRGKKGAKSGGGAGSGDEAVASADAQGDGSAEVEEPGTPREELHRQITLQHASLQTVVDAIKKFHQAIDKPPPFTSSSSTTLAPEATTGFAALLAENDAAEQEAQVDEADSEETILARLAHSIATERSVELEPSKLAAVDTALDPTDLSMAVENWCNDTAPRIKAALEPPEVLKHSLVALKMSIEKCMATVQTADKGRKILGFDFDLREELLCPIGSQLNSYQSIAKFIEEKLVTWVDAVGTIASTQIPKIIEHSEGPHHKRVHRIVLRAKNVLTDFVELFPESDVKEAIPEATLQYLDGDLGGISDDGMILPDNDSKKKEQEFLNAAAKVNEGLGEVILRSQKKNLEVQDLCRQMTLQEETRLAVEYTDAEVLAVPVLRVACGQTGLRPTASAAVQQGSSFAHFSTSVSEMQTAVATRDVECGTGQQTTIGELVDASVDPPTAEDIRLYFGTSSDHESTVGEDDNSAVNPSGSRLSTATSTASSVQAAIPEDVDSGRLLETGSVADQDESCENEGTPIKAVSESSNDEQLVREEQEGQHSSRSTPPGSAIAASMSASSVATPVQRQPPTVDSPVAAPPVVVAPVMVTEDCSTQTPWDVQVVQPQDEAGPKEPSRRASTVGSSANDEQPSPTENETYLVTDKEPEGVEEASVEVKTDDGDEAQLLEAEPGHVVSPTVEQEVDIGEVDTAPQPVSGLPSRRGSTSRRVSLAVETPALARSTVLLDSTAQTDEPDVRSIGAQVRVTPITLDGDVQTDLGHDVIAGWEQRPSSGELGFLVGSVKALADVIKGEYYIGGLADHLVAAGEAVDGTYSTSLSSLSDTVSALDDCISCLLQQLQAAKEEAKRVDAAARSRRGSQMIAPEAPKPLPVVKLNKWVQCQEEPVPKVDVYVDAVPKSVEESTEQQDTAEDVVSPNTIDQPPAPDTTEDGAQTDDADLVIFSSFAAAVQVVLENTVVRPVMQLHTQLLNTFELLKKSLKLSHVSIEDDPMRLTPYDQLPDALELIRFDTALLSAIEEYCRTSTDLLREGVASGLKTSAVSKQLEAVKTVKESGGLTPRRLDFVQRKEEKLQRTLENLRNTRDKARTQRQTNREAFHVVVMAPPEELHASLHGTSGHSATTPRVIPSSSPHYKRQHDGSRNASTVHDPRKEHGQSSLIPVEQYLMHFNPQDGVAGEWTHHSNSLKGARFKVATPRRGRPPSASDLPTGLVYADHAADLHARDSAMKKRDMNHTAGSSTMDAFNGSLSFKRKSANTPGGMHAFLGNLQEEHEQLKKQQKEDRLQELQQYERRRNMFKADHWVDLRDPSHSTRVVEKKPEGEGNRLSPGKTTFLVAPRRTTQYHATESFYGGPMFAPGVVKSIEQHRENERVRHKGTEVAVGSYRKQRHNIGSADVVGEGRYMLWSNRQSTTKNKLALRNAGGSGAAGNKSVMGLHSGYPPVVEDIPDDTNPDDPLAGILRVTVKEKREPRPYNVVGSNTTNSPSPLRTGVVLPTLTGPGTREVVSNPLVQRRKRAASLGANNAADDIDDNSPLVRAGSYGFASLRTGGASPSTPPKDLPPSSEPDGQEVGTVTPDGPSPLQPEPAGSGSGSWVQHHALHSGMRRVASNNSGTTWKRRMSDASKK